MSAIIIVLIILVVLVFIALIKTIQVIPQASAAIVERFGRYTRTLNAGLNIVVPFIDSIRNRIDLREQVVPFPPQPVITQDNLVVNIDTVIYYQVTDARAATYEVASYIQAIEQLTVTTLRNIIGGMDLERTLTSREEINAALRGVLDEATGKWGIRVNRVELKAIEPPTSIQDSMEKQMRADRDKRAAILTAEGIRQSQILTAEGEKQSAILRAEGEAKAAALRAEGEAQAIRTVFESIHAGDADQKLLAYQYLQMLPKIAEGDANKLWIVPSEIGDALKGLSGAMGNFGPMGGGSAPRAPSAANSPPSTDPPRTRRSPPRYSGGGLFRPLRVPRYAAVRASQAGSASRSDWPSVSSIASAGVGSNGSRSSGIPACSGVRSALRWLSSAHEATVFSQESAPPRDRGTTWSTVVARRPQYAHRCWSRTSTPRLDHGACLRKGTRMYLQSLITCGTGMSTAAARTRSPGWACSTTALSCSTSTTARLSVTVDNGSKLAFSTSVSRISPTSRTSPAHPHGGLGSTLAGRAEMDNAIKMPAPDHFHDRGRANSR